VALTGASLLALTFLLTSGAWGAGLGRIVIEAPEIAAAKVTRVYEILSQVPGVSAGPTSVSIHGSYKVKVFLDGSPLTDPSSGFNAVTWERLAPESLARIEILMDSGGLIYGQDASAGVILLTSKAEEKKFRGSLKVYGGDYGYFQSELDLAFQEGLWGLAVAAGREEAGGFLPNEDKLIHRGSLNVSRRLTEGSVSLGLAATDDERGLYGYPGFPTPEARKRARLFSLTQETRWRALANNLTYQRGRVANQDPSQAINQYLMVSELTDNLTLALEPASWLSLSLGTGFKRSWAESSDFTPQSEWAGHFFSRAEARLPWSGWSLAVGARYNRNSDFRDNLNPEATLNWARGDWSVSLKYNRSANTPTYQQRFNRSSSTRPNPDLDVEIADNLGLVATWRVNDKMSWFLSGFSNRLKGRITYDRPANSGFGQYKNLGLATYEGGDLGFDWKINSTVALKANVTYTRAKDWDLRKNLTGRSRLAGASEVKVQPLPELTTILTIEYRTAAWEDRRNTSKIPGYALYGLRAEWDLGRVSLTLSLENILNRAWLYSDGLEGPPRNFYLGLAYRF
jgi:iron complex outermembrane receptor protein